MQRSNQPQTYGDGEEFDLLGTPAVPLREEEPGFATVILDGVPVRVRTTPPPPRRRTPPPTLPVNLLDQPTFSIEPTAARAKPSPAPVPGTPWLWWIAVGTTVCALAGVAVFLFASAG